MNLAELFPEGGRGVIATADASGQVNTAVYAVPHVMDGETLAWGMSQGRTHSNLLVNPHASYLYLAPSRGGNGWRLTLQLKDIKDSGEMLQRIREHTARVVSPQAGEAVRYVAQFTVSEIRPLV
ncbi:pyridoxamine 5'-phosphate oxidase family protein [Geotalea sp. SG265]|uniref:pyridoxamine 5'-phosphate oxidase family protein n=1 Tax=Geotalea sp. SG265 TaxID=2922867 RepID=UPI001FAE94DF|nr:pyridoxamine 5'-phosphate oxidase family protein [Geotalea sp. SG265]